ncbi:hypothetical protein V2G26_017791 [Clonostachys chloroleuca]
MPVLQTAGPIIVITTGMSNLAVDALHGETKRHWMRSRTDGGKRKPPSPCSQKKASSTFSSTAASAPASSPLKRRQALGTSRRGSPT